jgi:hypothetical protein
MLLDELIGGMVFTCQVPPSWGGTEGDTYDVLSGSGPWRRVDFREELVRLVVSLIFGH